MGGPCSKYGKHVFLLASLALASQKGGLLFSHQWQLIISAPLWCYTPSLPPLYPDTCCATLFSTTSLPLPLSPLSNTLRTLCVSASLSHPLSPCSLVKSVSPICCWIKYSSHGASCRNFLLLLLLSLHKCHPWYMWYTQHWTFDVWIFDAFTKFNPFNSVFWNAMTVIRFDELFSWSLKLKKYVLFLSKILEFKRHLFIFYIILVLWAVRNNSTL